VNLKEFRDRLEALVGIAEVAIEADEIVSALEEVRDDVEGRAEEARRFENDEKDPD
jgi:hypothetical protein